MKSKRLMNNGFTAQISASQLQIVDLFSETQVSFATPCQPATNLPECGLELQDPLHRAREREKEGEERDR